MTLGAFVLVNTYVLQLVRPLEMLGFAIRDIGQGLGYLDRIGMILEEAPEHQGLPSMAADDLRPAGPADLAFEDVSSFGDRETLREISSRARPGALAGIVGRRPGPELLADDGLDATSTASSF